MPSTIMDYLDWRGELSFTEAPFNEVDNVILTYAAILDYEGIVPENSSITLAKAVAKYYERYGEKGKYMGLVIPAEAWTMMQKMASSRRFKDLVLSDYVNRVVQENTEQFSAITITLPGAVRFLSFRGTDDTIHAWKENFMMSIRDDVPARVDALNYLLAAAEKYRGTFIIGGHSKGGNVAIYAAAMAPKKVQDRILHVYSNDGPGFSKEFYETDGWKRIAEKATLIMPECSIVGTFFHRPEYPIYCKCGKTGIAAHDALCWYVMGSKMVRAEELVKGSRAFDVGMQTALDALNLEERVQFIDDFFDCMESTGATTLTDLSKLDLAGWMETLRAYSKKPEIYKIIKNIIGETVKASKEE